MEKAWSCAVMVVVEVVAAAVFKRNVNVSVCLLGLLFEGSHPVRYVHTWQDK